MIKPKNEYDSSFSILYDLLLQQDNLLSNLSNINSNNNGNETCNCGNNTEALLQALYDVKTTIENKEAIRETIVNQPIIKEKETIEKVKEVYIDKPVIVEKPVYIDKPIIVEKKIEIEKPVEKIVVKYVEKPIYIRDNKPTVNPHIHEHEHCSKEHCTTVCTHNYNNSNINSYKPTLPKPDNSNREKYAPELSVKIIDNNNHCNPVKYIRISNPLFRFQPKLKYPKHAC